VILPSAGGRASQLGQFSQAVVAAIGALERGVELANVMDAVSRNFGPGVAAAVHAYIKARDVEKDIAAGAKPSVNVEELGGVKAGPAAAITIDESYLPGLEKLFETATGGAGGGIRALLDAANKHHAVVDGLRRDVIKTQSRLQDAEMQVKELSDKLDEKAKAVQELERKLVVKEGEGKRVVWDIKGNAGEAAGGEAVPDGRMSMRPAKEVFGIEDGRLAFDIPVWEWDGSNPYVPEKDVDYAFDAEHVATLAFAVNRGRNLWVKGPTGSGKTSLIEQYCAWTGTMNMRVNLDSELSRMDLVGRDILKADGKGGTLSEFVEGILPKAMKLPCILTCDEMDAVRPDIAYVFQRVLEGKGLLLAEDGGRVIVPHPEFRLFATANTVGQGDEDGMYPAVRPQSQAMLDRFAFWMDVPYMEAEREVGLLMKRVPGLGKDEAERMVKFAGEVRRAFENGDCMQTISLRALVAMGEKFLATGDLSMAAMTTVLNKASKHDRATIKGLADASLLGGAVSL
jgi:cobaltochelatase CobS